MKSSTRYRQALRVQATRRRAAASSEVAGSPCVCVGPIIASVFDGPVWAHTSPVYVKVAGQRIASRQDAEYFVDWIEQMLQVVNARNRYASVEDRRQVEALFRRAQSEFRKMVDPK